MASLTIYLAKCDRVVAYTTVFTLEHVGHRVFGAAFLDGENIRMTQLTSVPDGVFLVGEDDVEHPSNLGRKNKILLHRELFHLERNSLYVVNQLYHPH